MAEFKLDQISYPYRRGRRYDKTSQSDLSAKYQLDRIGEVTVIAEKVLETTSGRNIYGNIAVDIKYSSVDVNSGLIAILRIGHNKYFVARNDNHGTYEDNATFTKWTPLDSIADPVPPDVFVVSGSEFTNLALAITQM